MGNWKSQAAEESGSQIKPELKVGVYKDLKVATVRPSDMFPNSWQLGVVSQSHDGWANLYLRLDQEWLNPALIAMAMGTSGDKDKNYRTKDTYLKAGQQDGTITAKDVIAADAYMQSYALEQVEKNNFPAEQIDEGVDRIKNNLLIQVKINIGTLWRLQEWAGLELNEHASPEEVKGTVFSGSVSDRNGKLKVKSVYSVPSGYVAPKPETAFQEVEK